MDSSGHDSQSKMMQMLAAKWISTPLYVAARLGIADMLCDGPKSVAEIALETGTHAPYLCRLMRALAGVGIFVEQDRAVYGLTPLGECLKTGAMRSVALMLLAEWHNRAWDRLLDCLSTGGIPFEQAHGMTAFEWFEHHPEEAKAFHEANAFKVDAWHAAILKAYDFTGIDVLTDVGGGYGALMIRILEANRHMKGVIADRPFALETAEQAVRARGLEDRCQVVQCDFLSEIPPGSDAHLLSNILHDWDDEHCRLILRNCHRALASGQKLLVVEMAVPSGNRFSVAKLLDLEVLVMGGGRERTLGEFKCLLETSGFRLERAIPTGNDVTILECLRQET